MVNRLHGTVAAADAVSLTLLKFLVFVVVGGGGFFREKKLCFPYHWYSTSSETLSSVMHSAKNYAYIIMCH